MDLRFALTQPELAKALGLTDKSISIQAGKLSIDSQKIGNRTAYAPSAVRSILESRGFKYPKKVLSFQMLKGGSTKTSSAFNLAIRLNRYGARVLVIDADAQYDICDGIFHHR